MQSIQLKRMEDRSQHYGTQQPCSSQRNTGTSCVGCREGAGGPGIGNKLRGLSDRKELGHPSTETSGLGTGHSRAATYKLEYGTTPSQDRGKIDTHTNFRHRRSDRRAFFVALPKSTMTAALSLRKGGTPSRRRRPLRWWMTKAVTAEESGASKLK